MSTVVELVKRNFELANEVSELKKENARLREALEGIERFQILTAQEFQILTAQDMTLPMERAREALEMDE